MEDDAIKQRFLAATDEEERAAFVSDIRRRSNDLWSRCNALLPEQPVSRDEWIDADLAGMDGFDATDDELVAFWRTFRRAVDLGWDESPDLRSVTDALAAGQDPVKTVAEAWES